MSRGFSPHEHVRRGGELRRFWSPYPIFLEHGVHAGPSPQRSSPTRVLATQRQSRSARCRLPNDVQKSPRHIRTVFAPHSPEPRLAGPGHWACRASVAASAHCSARCFSDVSFFSFCLRSSVIAVGHEHPKRLGHWAGMTIAMRDGQSSLTPCGNGETSSRSKVSFQPSFPRGRWRGSCTPDIWVTGPFHNRLEHH